MTERNIAAEVLAGLHEVQEHRAGKRTLRTTRVEAKPLPGLTPDMIKRIREEPRRFQERYSPTCCAYRCAPLRAGSRAGPVHRIRRRPLSSWPRNTQIPSSDWHHCELL